MSENIYIHTFVFDMQELEELVMAVDENQSGQVDFDEVTSLFMYVLRCMYITRMCVDMYVCIYNRVGRWISMR
jgi:hypothetical protein